VGAVGVVVAGTQHLDGGGATAGAIVTDHEIVAFIGRWAEAAGAEFGGPAANPRAVGAALVLHILRQAQWQQLLDAAG